MPTLRVQSTEGVKKVITLPSKYGVMKIRELVKNTYKYPAKLYYYGKPLTKDNYKEAVAKDITLIYERAPCKMDNKTKRCNTKPRVGGNRASCMRSSKGYCKKR